MHIHNSRVSPGHKRPRRRRSQGRPACRKQTSNFKEYSYDQDQGTRTRCGAICGPQLDGVGALATQANARTLSVAAGPYCRCIAMFACSPRGYCNSATWRCRARVRRPGDRPRTARASRHRTACEPLPRTGVPPSRFDREGSRPFASSLPLCSITSAYRFRDRAPDLSDWQPRLFGSTVVGSAAADGLDFGGRAEAFKIEELHMTRTPTISTGRRAANGKATVALAGDGWRPAKRFSVSAPCNRVGCVIVSPPTCRRRTATS